MKEENTIVITEKDMQTGGGFDIKHGNIKTLRWTVPDGVDKIDLLGSEGGIELTENRMESSFRTEIKNHKINIGRFFNRIIEVPYSEIIEINEFKKHPTYGTVYIKAEWSMGQVINDVLKEYVNYGLRFQIKKSVIMRPGHTLKVEILPGDNKIKDIDVVFWLKMRTTTNKDMEIG